jgi:hypothetical protein
VAEGSQTFKQATIEFEVGSISHKPDGRTEIRIYTDYASKAQAVKLTDAYGLLLRATVRPVTREGA